MGYVEIAPEQLDELMVSIKVAFGIFTGLYAMWMIFSLALGNLGWRRAGDRKRRAFILASNLSQSEVLLWSRSVMWLLNSACPAQTRRKSA
jgi:hypothetical protein